MKLQILRNFLFFYLKYDKVSAIKQIRKFRKYDDSVQVFKNKKW